MATGHSMAQRSAPRRLPLATLGSSSSNSLGDPGPTAPPTAPKKQRKLRRLRSASTRSIKVSSTPGCSSSIAVLPRALALDGEHDDGAAATPAEVTPVPSSQGSRPELAARQSSVLDTKTLLVRSATFASESFCFQGDYAWLHALGSGSFADVWEVAPKARPGERYAVKCFKQEFRSRKEREQQLQEARLANEVPPHGHVVAYHRVWQDARVIYILMELCEGGTLREQSITCPPRANPNRATCCRYPGVCAALAPSTL